MDAALITEAVDDPVRSASDPAHLLPNRLAAWAAADPDRPFLTEVDGPRLTYGEFHIEVRRWMTWLTGLGIGAGDRVASFLPGSVDAYLLWMAAAGVGAYEVPVSTDLRGEFLEHVLVDSKAVLAVVRPSEFDLVHGAAPDLHIEIVPAGQAPASTLPPVESVPVVAPDGVSCVIYTSGTTGAAKGVVISHGQLASIIGRLPRSWISEDDTVYACWPMAHVTGRSPAIAMADVGGQVVIRERFSNADFWSDIREYHCTSTTAAAVVPLLMAAPPRDDDHDHPLRTVWFAKLGRAALEFQQRFGVIPLASYGSTEVGFPIAHRQLTEDNAYVTGWLRPGYEARLVDQNGADVPAGQPGELLIRPPVRHMVLLGYLDRPELTERAMSGGWYHTGDSLTRDESGAFRFVDRLTDTIRRFGENISASALEDAINHDPQVRECAVIGKPSRVTGQDVFLVVVPKGDPGAFDSAGLWERLSVRLPRYMLPSEIAVVDDLPRSPNGKVRKRVLIEPGAVTEPWTAPRTSRTRPSVH